GNGAVIGTEWSSPSQVVEELAFDAVHNSPGPPGSVACRETPAVLPVALEIHRISNRVLLLHVGRVAAVLEVVTVVLLHEGVTDAAKVDPHVRKLVRKERPRVEQLAVVDRFPLVGRAIGLIAFWRQWMRRRAETENVGQQPLVVALPAVRDESGL